MKQDALVIKTDGDKATVTVLRKEACSHCAGRVVCGNAKTMTVVAKNTADAAVGDTVVIETPTESVLGYAALVFLAPVLLSIVLYVIFSQINTLLSVIIPICGFVLPFVIALVIDRKKREERLPRITEIIKEGDETPPCNDGE